MLKLLKPKIRENAEEEPESETRFFDTPTKVVRIRSTQNDDPSTSRNNCGLKRMCTNDRQCTTFTFS